MLSSIYLPMDIKFVCKEHYFAIAFHETKSVHVSKYLANTYPKLSILRRHRLQISDLILHILQSPVDILGDGSYVQVVLNGYHPLSNGRRQATGLVLLFRVQVCCSHRLRTPFVVDLMYWGIESDLK